MKTKNLILIVALLSIATLTFSQSSADRPNEHFTVKITLKCALQNSSLVKAMHEQLNPEFLNETDGTRLFTVAVRLNGTRYLISGTYEEWKKFFEAALDNPIPER
jgi:hypothetical protein